MDEASFTGWSIHYTGPRFKWCIAGLKKSFYDALVSPPLPTRHFVCVGRLCEQKGQLLLIEAAHSLAAGRTDFELVLAGDGELRADIEALIARHQLKGKVHITGWISNVRVREEILAARAMVLPSFAEGLPVVLMEAMALGRPVISTYLAGIPELVSPTEHGWLVPAGDIESLRQAMRACVDAPTEMLARMGRPPASARLTVITQIKRPPSSEPCLKYPQERMARSSSGILVGQFGMPKVNHPEIWTSRQSRELLFSVSVRGSDPENVGFNCVNEALDPGKGKHAHPEMGSERSFGLVFAAVFTFIGVWPLVHHANMYPWSLAIAALFLAAAFLAPRALAPLNRLWFRIGILLGKVVTPLLMGVLFVVAVTPVALLMRILGNDPLRLKRKPAVKSYWIDRSPPGPVAGSFKNQF